MMNPAQTRRHIRKLRRSLPRATQLQHEKRALVQLKRSGLLHRYKHFAIYLDADGELPTGLIIQHLLSYRKRVYLPVLYPFGKNRLWFVAFDKNSRKKINRFKIIEPAGIARRKPAVNIDVIFMPLVAFDTNGNRLGMGGGFYDRTLSDCKKQGKNKKPLLIGLAHELQKTTRLQTNKWDIPLDSVITKQQLYKFI